MQTPNLPRRIPSRIEVGQKSSFSRTLTEADVVLFIGVTWDVNPLHTDDSYVRELPIKRRIVPGLLTASLLTHIGGLWAFLAQEMKLQFLAPVYIGDTLTAEVEIAQVERERGWIRLTCRCVDSQGTVVLQAEISGYPGHFNET